MEGVPVDLQTKYHKLAAEYSKIRAQAAVLKKAVIEEQSKNTELKDVLKERDQSLRKADQEMDSLNFRNQQLTKRVTVLQDELEGLQIKFKKSKGKNTGGPQPTDFTNNVIDEEFQKKIAENAELLSMMHEKDISYQLQVSEMTDRLEKLQYEVQKFKKCNNDAEENYKAVIESLQSEKEKLESRLSSKEKELQKSCSRIFALEQKLKETEEDLRSKLEAANTIIVNHLPFVDKSFCGDLALYGYSGSSRVVSSPRTTVLPAIPPASSGQKCSSGWQELNELNVPQLDRRRQAWCLHLVAQVGSHVSDLATGLSDFHTYTEQRVTASSDSLSPVNAKFSAHLKDNARYLRALEQGYRDFQEGLENDIIVALETVPSIQKFSRALSSYVTYLQKLLPYHLLRFLLRTGIFFPTFRARCCVQLQTLKMDPAAGPKRREENSSTQQKPKTTVPTATHRCESLQEDCKDYSSEDNLRIKNMEIHEKLSVFTSLFSKLNTYIGLLSVQSKRSCQHPKPSQKRFLLDLSDVFTALHLCTKELSKMYCLKLRLERDIPTISEKVKTTDECLVNSLIAVVTCTGKLSEIISDSKSQILKDDSPSSHSSIRARKNYKGSNAHPLVGDFKKRAANYLSILNQEGEQASVPYEEALWAREEARSGVAGREALEKQLEGCQHRATRLEQEVEHWRLEYQLLQLRYSKEVQKAQEIKDQLKILKSSATFDDNPADNLHNSLSTDASEEQGSIPNSVKCSTVSNTTSNMLGKLGKAMEFPAEVEAREKEIKEYFIARINQLVADRQVSESKALTLHSELTILHKRLELCNDCKSDLESKQQNMADHLKELQEELQTTTQNYESQLSMMSEHLANMNEKLTVQKDKIDELTYQLSNKTSRKGKLK